MLSSFQNRIILLIIGIIVFLTAALSAVIGLRLEMILKRKQAQHYLTQPIKWLAVLTSICGGVPLKSGY